MGALDITGDVTPAVDATPAGGGTGTPAPTDTPAVDSPEFDWKAKIDPEILKEANVATFKDLNDLAKSYVHAQKMVGKDKIVLPDPEYATDEEWSDVYKKLGLPERDKYQIKFAEDQAYDEDFKKAFTDQAHQAGVLPKQAQKIWEFMHTQITDASKKSGELHSQKVEEEVKNLQKEWGSGYSAEIAVAQQAFKQFADENDIKYFKESGLAGDPKMIKFLNKIGKSLNEDTFDRDTVKHLGLTKEEAQRKMNTINGNSKHPYWDAKHPSHKQAVEDMQKYYQVMNSEEE